MGLSGEGALVSELCLPAPHYAAGAGSLGKSLGSVLLSRFFLPPVITVGSDELPVGHLPHHSGESASEPTFPARAAE